MCGRFTQKLTPQEVCDLYGVTGAPPSFAREPRYNGAPTQDFAVCRIDDGGGRRMSFSRGYAFPIPDRTNGMPSARG